MAYSARSVVVGIDNGGTMNNATVLDPGGRFLVQQMLELPSRVREGPAVAIAALTDSFGEVLKITGIEPAEVRAVGLDSPGPASADGVLSSRGATNFGHPDWGAPFFGVGVFSWLAIESVLLHRLYTVIELPPPLRPTMGIQLAPPAVGCSAYLSITSGPPDLFAQALIGYGLFQVLLMIRLLPWILRQPFAPSYWAFTFGLSALAISFLRFVERGATGPIPLAAPYVFIAVSLTIGGIAAGTLWLLLRGRLLPPPLQPPPESLHPTPRVI